MITDANLLCRLLKIGEHFHSKNCLGSTDLCRSETEWLLFYVLIPVV